MSSKTEEARFWAKVDKARGPSGCWLWTAGKNDSGYGKFGSRKFGTIYAHRFSWIEANGGIPDGLCILHKCDVPLCVNPEHLFIGTRTDNAADRCQKGRQAKGEQAASKLNEGKVRQIRELASTGASYPDIASRFGVGTAQICRIVKRKRWTHI